MLHQSRRPGNSDDSPFIIPFFLVTQRMKREVVYSPLDLKDGQYQIDFERFRKDIQGCKY